jgi:CBS domain-containing protein
MREQVTIAVHAPLQRAVELLLRHGVRELVVLDENDRVVGLLDEHDVSRAALRHVDPGASMAAPRPRGV